METPLVQQNIKLKLHQTLKIKKVFLKCVMIFFFLFALSACGKQFKVTNYSQASLCTTNDNKPKNQSSTSFVSVFKDSKVLLMKENLNQMNNNQKTENSENEIESAASAYIEYKDDSEILPKGFSLSVNIDHICLNEKRKSNKVMNMKEQTESFLTKNLRSREIFTSTSRTFSSSAPSSIETFIVPLENDLSVGDLKNIVNQDSCITGVSKRTDGLRILGDLNDSFFPKLNHLKAINFSKANEIFFNTTKGIKKDVVIAIIDTGVDYNHADLKANMWVNKKEAEGQTGVDDDKNGFIDDIYGYDFAGPGDGTQDNNNSPPDGDPMPQMAADSADPVNPERGHGTHCAGLSAAVGDNGVGVSGLLYKKARIMAIKVGTDQAINMGGSKHTVLTDAAISNGIRYAADNGAQVINLSLGSPEPSASIRDSITYGLQKNVVFLIASGNDNKSSLFYPAGYAKDMAGVLSIGATDASTAGKCSFSNHGPSWVDIGVPGCDSGGTQNTLISTFPTGLYVGMAGTSMATPVMAGAAALAIGLVGDRTNKIPKAEDMETLLKDSAAKKTNLESFFAQGRYLDLLKLAEKIDKDFPFNTSTPTPTPPPATPTPEPSCE